MLKSGNSAVIGESSRGEAPFVDFCSAPRSPAPPQREAFSHRRKLFGELVHKVDVPLEVFSEKGEAGSGKWMTLGHGLVPLVAETKCEPVVVQPPAKVQHTLEVYGGQLVFTLDIV